MEWRKSSVVTGLSLLLVALIGAIKLSDYHGFSDELQFSGTKSIIEWYRDRSGFGLEFEYRPNGESVSGFTRLGAIGKLFTNPASGLTPLRVFALSTDSNVRMYRNGGAVGRYTKYLGIAGYCSRMRVSGSTAFIQLSKRTASIGRTEFAYAYSQASLDELKKIGYGNQQRLCYIQAVVPPSVGIRKFVRDVDSFRYYEYGNSGSATPEGYRRGGMLSVVLLSHSYLNFVPIRKYYNPSLEDSMLSIEGERTAGYTMYRGIIGYCSTTLRSSEYLPIYKYCRYTVLGTVRDHAYTATITGRRALRRRGFKNEGVLCYARQA